MSNSSPAHLEHAALQLLEKALRTYAQVRTEPQKNIENRTLDLLLRLENGTVESDPIAVELKRYPQQHREAHEVTPVWVLEDAPYGLHENLRQDGKSFVDLTGIVHLRLPGLIIDRTDLPAVSVSTYSDTGRSPFSDRASCIPRMLLSVPQRNAWTVSKLADEAGVPYSTAWYATKALEERLLVTVNKAGRENRITLNDPEALLREWTTEYSLSKNRTLKFRMPIGNTNRFLHRLSENLPEKLRWALSVQAGAHLVAPHADWKRIHFYADVQTAREGLNIISVLGGEPADDGQVTLMIPYYEQSVWTNLRTIDALPVVSTVQLVLDLWNYPVRGREQAEHLIETVLMPIWNDNG